MLCNLPQVMGNPVLWVNPKIVVGDPMKARLQQGRKELTSLEKEEIARYGYTGLEIMTYVYANKHLKSLSDLPPEPKARLEVWEKTRTSQVTKP
jgi:hypothetical protein